MDAKTTRGIHETAFHLTIGELRWVARHPGYRIARISSLTETSADVRILRNVRGVCVRSLEPLTNLPRGIWIDSYEVEPALFAEVTRDLVNWGPEGT